MALSAHAGRHTVPDFDATLDGVTLEQACTYDKVLWMFNHEVSAAPLFDLSFGEQPERPHGDMRRRKRTFGDCEMSGRAGPGAQRLKLRSRDGVQPC